MQTITEPRQVITWQAPNGGNDQSDTSARGHLEHGRCLATQRQREYCQVSHGLHPGYPNYSSDYIRWCAHYGYNSEDPATWSDFGRYCEERAVVESLAAQEVQA